MKLISHNKVTFSETEAQAAYDVIMSGNVVNHNKCRELEAKWCEITGAQDACMVSSGFSALRLALIALDVGYFNEVMIPAYSCVCLLNSVKNVEAEYILADIEDNLTLSVDSIANNFNKSVNAVIAVHTFGAYADIKSLNGLGTQIIEDMSHGIFEQKADLAIASFGPTKFIGSISGGIVSGSKELISKVRDFSNYGDKKPSIRQNDSGSEIAAAIVLEKLKRLDEIKQNRLDAADKYDLLLRDINYEYNGAAFCDFNADYPYRYIIKLDNAKQISEKMKALGVQAELPVYEYQDNWEGLPETKEAFDTVLSLPFYPDITLEEQQQVVKVLNDIL